MAKVDNMNKYEIINARIQEKIFIDKVLKYISDNYSDKLNIQKLRKIEIVDKLPGGSSGRTIRDKVILSRKNGIDRVKGLCPDKLGIDNSIMLRDIISTIYHELWHVSTWDNFVYLYEYVLDENNEDWNTILAYLYWIEYLAHVETVFMEVPEVMRKFCKEFVYREWKNTYDEYFYFVKVLPYYLIRSQYLNLYDELTQKITSNKLRQAVYDFDCKSKLLLHNSNVDDIEKANDLKSMIEGLLV